MQRHLSYYFCSLTTDMNRVTVSQNPPVPTARPSRHDSVEGWRGVRVHYFLLLAVCQSPFVSSQWPL